MTGAPDGGDRSDGAEGGERTESSDANGSRKRGRSDSKEGDGKGDGKRKGKKERAIEKGEGAIMKGGIYSMGKLRFPCCRSRSMKGGI